MKKRIGAILPLVLSTFIVTGQANKKQLASKPISADLFGIFFEDLSYAADGGLYGELLQNRSFEYSPADRRGWDAFTGWQYITEGYGYGNISVATTQPLHPNNPHYAVLRVEEEGQQGICLANAGYDGISLKAGAAYSFSLFARQLDGQSMPLAIKIVGKKGETCAVSELNLQSPNWKKYSTILTATQSCDSARLLVLAKAKGAIALDEISLFPQNTFRNRPNGMRADLAQAIAELHPGFMRFPGGCLVHGDGLGNIYRWKNTIGPVEQRMQQRNIWNYHQSVGLGFFEYFQFCEDIGAKPLPVVAAAVSCQNSGGTWRIGGTGQRGLPISEMDAYIQDILDLIEYANGPATSTWGARRAAAGHPAPFHLQYIGIGNEDKQTDAFRKRFQLIYEAVKAKHPEITVIGTVGPFHTGDDYTQGWQLASRLQVPVVDEHYYEKPEWFLANANRYDDYNRKQSKVYIGEYASHGNTLYNALCEAAYMTSLERNGDVVQMASYAPLLANMQHTSWNPNLIYFTNTEVVPTVNYYVQQLFALHHGNRYYSGAVAFSGKKDSTLAASCVSDDSTGDLIIKLVNAGPDSSEAIVHLPKSHYIEQNAGLTFLTGPAKAKNTLQEPNAVKPVTSQIRVSRSFRWKMPAYSLQVIRIKTKRSIFASLTKK